MTDAYIKGNIQIDSWRIFLFIQYLVEKNVLGIFFLSGYLIVEYYLILKCIDNMLDEN